MMFSPRHFSDRYLFSVMCRLISVGPLNTPIQCRQIVYINDCRCIVTIHLKLGCSLDEEIYASAKVNKASIHLHM